MNQLIRKMHRIIIFCIAFSISKILYDKKYITGKYFGEGKLNTNALGWNWIIKDFLGRVFLGVNRKVPFPISSKIVIGDPSKIIFHPDDLNNFQGMGNYYQTVSDSKIIIGKGCWIAPNVGLITANHDVSNPDNHCEGKDIILGEKCWIGMNSIVLPGVILGPHTTVGAGSVVTKSFEDGYCVIVGNPARIIRKIKS